MKKLTLIISIIFFSTIAFSEDYNLHVEGTVVDESTGDPMFNQEMIISIDSLVSGFTYNNTVFTDEQGYFEDDIFVPDSSNGVVEVTTIACNQPFSQNEFFSENIMQLFFSFSVCTDPTGNSCEAFYSYYDDNEPLAIQFVDMSMGFPTNWYWDFGDGTTSVEQNPLHFYDDVGIYATSLTIFSDSCQSEFELMVDVTYDTIMPCEAYFLYEPGANPLSIQFIDNSIGSITDYSWDFGDGGFSNEQNPLHLYTESGLYNVSLFIQSGDTCNSFFNEDVFVYGDTTYCNADFYVTLDTLNNTPNTYIFTDASEGDVESWYWDFGDGTFSFIQNPVHVYSNSGEYRVCLTISTLQTGGGMCTSTQCKDVITNEYYNFGGQVFIGDYPINVDSGDIENVAVAYLYRKIDNVWQYMDEREFWEFGYYWFVDKPKGEYLILSGLTENSVDYSRYAPAYFGNSSTWKNANAFNLQNSQQFAVNINLHELTESALGVGNISGEVAEGPSCDTMHNIDLNNVLIYLFNSTKQLISYQYSDENGNYAFSGLSNGDYTIKPEYPGRYSSESIVTVTNENPNVDNVEVVVYCSQALGIDDFESQYNYDISDVYPNPVLETGNIKIKLQKPETLIIKVFNQYGQSYYYNKINLSPDLHTISFPTTKLTPGMYFVQLTTTSNVVVVRKFIK